MIGQAAHVVSLRLSKWLAITRVSCRPGWHGMIAPKRWKLRKTMHFVMLFDSGGSGSKLHKWFCTSGAQVVYHLGGVRY
jgi:hypothetical protein